MENYTTRFIERATQVHSSFYDYSQFIYNGNHTKGTILCQVHGEFEQTPANHMNGSGCPKCARDKHADPNKHLTNFIQKAEAVYENRYDYSQFVWTGAQSKGIIVCSEHGSFEKTPEKHISRQQGCPECSKKKKSENRTYTVDQFLEKAKDKHSDTYVYDSFIYVDSQTKGKITCRSHGEFLQLPAQHLQGQGCPECAKEKSKQTQLERYGVEHHSQSPEFKEKVKKTSLDRFGTEHYSKTDDYKNRQKKTNIEKFGVENPSQLPEFQEQVRKTSLKKYGVEHHSQLPEFKEKLIATNLERYGVESTTQLPEVQERIKQTTLERFGVENASQSPLIKERVKQTNLDRFGVEYTFQSEEIREKGKQTNLERYGFEFASQAQEIKDKVKQSNLEHFGVESAFQAPEVREKIKQTNLERYGFENVSQAPEIRERVKQTVKEHYGVEYVLQAEEVKAKIRETNLARYGVENPSQSPEIKAKVVQTNIELFGRSNKSQVHIAPESLIILNDKILLNEALTLYSVTELAIGLGVKPTTVGRYCRKSDILLPSSSYERAIATFLQENDINIKLHDRLVIAPKEIDVLLPDQKIGIEFCGLYWHSDDVITEKTYHLRKLINAQNAGYKLITIFEDEWLHRRSIVESRLLHTLGKGSKGKGARELTIKPISAKEIGKFLVQYHIQGVVHGFAKYGAFDGETMVAVMSFCHPRSALGRKEGADELLRFATDGKYYPGVASRLFKAFVNEYQPEKLISYADRRWSEGKLYENLGFKLLHTSRPNYWYVNNRNIERFLVENKEGYYYSDTTEIVRHYRYNYRKDVVKDFVEDGDEKSEPQIMEELGYTRIWDCGNLVYEWTSQ